MGEELSDMAEAQLIAEQLRHTIDLLRAEIAQLKQVQDHDREMSGHRLKSLEELGRDHETRLRSATDGITQFKTWSGLSNGGSVIMSIVAFLRAWLGP
jgi:hypothetical protein